MRQSECFGTRKQLIRLNDAKKLFTFVVCEPIKAKNIATIAAVVVEVIDRKIVSINLSITAGNFSKDSAVIYRLETIQLAAFGKVRRPCMKLKSVNLADKSVMPIRMTKDNC